MRALRNADVDLRFIGRGGPQMKAVAVANFQNWIEQSGVLGLWEVIKHYSYFRKQFHETLREIKASKPNAVVLIDYPGFNLRLARALRKQSPAQKIIYYISPQVWAWNRGRIKKMARFIDLVLCIFPFESDLYNKSGLRAVFVGHPMIERLQVRKIETERDPNLIGLFPGSRLREVRKIFPVMIETANLLLQAKPTLHFQVAAASEELAREINKMLDPHLRPLPSTKGEETQQASTESRRRSMSEDMTGTPLSSSRGEGRVRGAVRSQERQVVQIKVGETAALMQRAFVGIVASGSATLEAAYFRMPFVLIYKVAWPTYLGARLVVNVEYLGMPNLLAGKEVVPEFIQHRADPGAIAGVVRPLMEDAPAREQMISEFDTIIGKLGTGGATERAARAVIEEISDGA